MRVYSVSVIMLRVVLACAALTCVPATIHAQPLSNPASTLERSQWALGLGGGGFWKRKLKGGANVSAVGIGHFRGYGLTDWLSVYANIGAAYVTARDAALVSSNPGVGSRFGANAQIDLQLKSRLWRSPHRQWEWDASTQYTFMGAPHKQKADQADWNEWQLATSVAKRLGPVTPYIGAKVSLLQFQYVRHGVTTTHGHYSPKGIFGPVLGLDWALGAQKDTVVNLEGSYTGGVGVLASVIKRY